MDASGWLLGGASVGVQASMGQLGLVPILGETESSAKGSAIQLTLFAGLLGGIVFWAALATLHRRWTMSGISTSPCRSVCFGQTEVEGRTAPLDQPLRTPIGGREAVWYEWDLREFRSRGRSGRWVTVEKRATAAPFWLEDESGRVLVRPRGAEVTAEETVSGRLRKKLQPPQTRRELRELVLAGEDVIERARSLDQPDLLTGAPIARRLFGRDRGDDPPLRDLGGNYSITERAILVGSHAYVLGEPSERIDGPGYEFDASRAKVFIAGRSEVDQRRTYARASVGAVLVALLCSGAAAWAYGTWRTDRFQPSWISLVVGIELALIVGLWGFHLTKRGEGPHRRAQTSWSVVERSLALRGAMLQELGLEVLADGQAVRAVPETAEAPSQEATLPSAALVTAARALDRAQQRVVAAHLADLASRPEDDADSRDPELIDRFQAAAITIDAAMFGFDAAARRCTGPPGPSSPSGSPPLALFELGDTPRPPGADRPPTLAPPFSVDGHRGR